MNNSSTIHNNNLINFSTFNKDINILDLLKNKENTSTEFANRLSATLMAKPNKELDNLKKFIKEDDSRKRRKINTEKLLKKDPHYSKGEYIKTFLIKAFENEDMQFIAKIIKTISPKQLYEAKPALCLYALKDYAINSVSFKVQQELKDLAVLNIVVLPQEPDKESLKNLTKQNIESTKEYADLFETNFEYDPETGVPLGFLPPDEFA